MIILEKQLVVLMDMFLIQKDSAISVILLVLLVQELLIYNA